MSTTHHDARVVKIDEFTSTAYDKVATVADNVDAILAALATSEADHSGLLNRDLADAHPQSSITGLVDALAQINVFIAALQEEDIDLADLLQQHADLTDVHFSDVPADDDIEYFRKNQAWSPFDATLHDHDTLYDPIGSADAVQANLDILETTVNTHDHDSDYDVLGAAAAAQAAVQANVDAVVADLAAHDHDAEYLGIKMLDSGSALPDPSGYPEGAIFIVTV